MARSHRHRKEPMKRGKGLSRRGRPNPQRNYRTLSDIEEANRRRFHEEAWNQRVCASCGTGGAYESHHVVEKKYLKQMFRADLLWDPRNCLRLCHQCHRRHTVRSKKLLLTMLVDANYEFAEWLLEGAAFYYLRRNYDGKDPRLSDLQTRWEDDGDSASTAAESV
jgi:5-methylcytosine-specific restriction endonuclease McrA